MKKALENGILVISASIIAAIRLRGEPINPSPKLSATIIDPVQLPRMVLEAVEKKLCLKNAQWILVFCL